MAVIKNMTENYMEEKGGVYFADVFTVIITGTQGRNLRQKPEGRN